MEALVVTLLMLIHLQIHTTRHRNMHKTLLLHDPILCSAISIAEYYMAVARLDTGTHQLPDVADVAVLAVDEGLIMHAQNRKMSTRMRSLLMNMVLEPIANKG